MKKLILSALLCLPAAAYSQELNRADLEAMPPKGETGEAAVPAQRPEAQKILSDISTALRLSSKQEERITSALKKQSAEFDKLMKEYDKNLTEEKKWRYKMNESRYALQKLSRGIPDIVREYLDDEQRESFDELLASRKKPAEAVSEGEEGAPQARKKKLVKRRKAPAPEAAAEQGEEGGQTMVDKGDGKPALKKKKVLKRKPAPKAAAEPAAEEPAADEPAGAAPTGKEAGADEEDAGSYP